MVSVNSPKPPTGSAETNPIVQDVVCSLRASGYPDLFGLSCECHDGVITLAGRVGSYFLKQIAQTAAGRVPGVMRVDNQVHVT
jgi:osmotically-inducible protein OsmY